MNEFTEDHCADHGVEPPCRVLPISPATFYGHLAKRADPLRLSVRAERNADLKPWVERVFEETLSIYGVRKVWHQMRREGFYAARCTVVRLIKDLGLEGIVRGEKPKTTIPDKALPCPLDNVNRQFHAPAPNVLWVSDFTYVASRQGVVYVALVYLALVAAALLCCWRANDGARAPQGSVGWVVFLLAAPICAVWVKILDDGQLRVTRCLRKISLGDLSRCADAAFRGALMTNHATLPDTSTDCASTLETVR